MLALNTPIFYSLELAKECNNNCFLCSNSFMTSGCSQYSTAWSSILNSILPHIEVLKLTGGEPTLHPDFEDIIHFLSAQDIKFTVFTNARWTNPAKLLNALHSIQQCGGLLISLHGHNSSIHDAFTNMHGSFDETCENIHRATSIGLRIHTSTVLTCHNYHYIREIVALSEKLGAECAVFNRYIGLVLPQMEPTSWQIKNAIKDIENMRVVKSHTSSIKIKYGNCIPQCFATSSSTGCWAGIAYCTIDQDGNLRPCNHSPTVAGNILEVPIERIWNNDVMNSWRSFLPKECFKCAELEICHGGCKAQAELRNAKQDLLINGPIINREFVESDMTLDLYENCYPLLQCKVKEQSFGYALVNGNSFLPVKTDAVNVFNILDGKRTLRQIKSKYGQETLDFIGSLYLHGLLKLNVHPPNFSSTK